MPISSKMSDDDAVEGPLAALAEVLADGEIVGEEAEALAKLANGVRTGCVPERTVPGVSLRHAVFEDDVLAAGNLHQLTGTQAAAKVAVSPRGGENGRRLGGRSTSKASREKISDHAQPEHAGVLHFVWCAHG